MDQNDTNNQEAVPDVQPTLVEPPQPPTTESKPLGPDLNQPINEKKSRKLLIIIVLSIVLIAAIATAISFITKDSSNGSQSTNTNQKESSNNKELSANSELENFLEPATGEVWYEEAIEIGSKGWLIVESNEYSTPVKYYEVGTHGENKIVTTVIEELGAYIEFYELSQDGKVKVIKDISSTTTPRNSDNFYEAGFTSLVETDSETHYDSLSIPTEGLKLESGYLLYGPEFMTADSSYDPGEGTTVNDELTTPAGKVIKFETTYEEPGLKKTWFQYKISPGYVFNLTYTPMNKDGKSITWQSGDKQVDAEYSPIVRGCGIGTGISTGYRLQDSDMKPVGTNSDGQQVYELVSQDYKLLTKAVEEYNEFYSYEENFQPINKQTMVDKHGVIFYKDSVGNWLVYTRDDLSPQAGCAKPVVYLYPETTTNVRVRVGADVKISDPLYPANGWDVLAQPNGNLTVDGQNYGSLFWEGPGRGQYPGITTGKIVATNDAIRTIRTQLKTLGLNQTEIDDFVEYWQDKLPNKPYTRLTWLTTEQLNQLAPLFITPKPDTIIRVFLDYSGLDEPYELKEQSLTSIPRKGFTVVEWGGLSPFRLY